MAIMRPQKITEELFKDPFRGPELTFYKSAQDLSDEFIVLYGVTWFINTGNNSWNEGEADFVILSPKTGITIIEIKGGRIGRDDEGWYSIDRYNVIHRIKDPILQAANCKHKLIHLLKTNTRFNDKYIPAKHMVCFPNVLKKDMPKMIDFPEEMQIAFEDLENLQKKIITFAKNNYSGRLQSLSSNDCNLIAEILKPNFDCPTKWSVMAYRQTKIMDHLTEDQNYIWSMIDENDKIGICGPAGSGKTLLGLKYIKDCLNKGKKVLAFVPSKLLKEYYIATINNSDLDVLTYETLNCSNIEYDVIVIDEAQDVSGHSWFVLYNKFNIEKVEKLIVIYDANQKLLLNREFFLPNNLFIINLTKIIRNTKQIAMFSSYFYENIKKVKAIGPEGLNVEFITKNNSTSVEQEVVKAIKELVFKEDFAYQDIVVLSGKGNLSYLKKNTKNNQLGISFRGLDNDTLSLYKHPFVSAGSVYKYRGLESQVIILTDIDNLNQEKFNAACYVGSSRARSLLLIICSEATQEKITKK